MDIDSIWKTIQSNQILQTGFSLGLAGGMVTAVIMYFKNFNTFVWEAFARYFILTIHQDNNEDKSHTYLKLWLEDFFKNKKQKNFSVVHTSRDDNYHLIPGYGKYFFRLGYKIGFINVTKKEVQNSLSNTQIITIKILFGKKEDAHKIIDEGQKLYDPNKNLPKIYKNWYGRWRDVNYIEDINLNNYFYDNNLVDLLIKDIEKFFGSKEWYKNLSIPWHRGYIFDGPPGNGKSSLIKLLASYFKKNLCILDLNKVSSIDNLLELLNSIPQGSFVAIEDADTFNVIANRKKNKNGNFEVDDEGNISLSSSLSLSNILNCLDGIGVPSDGRLIFVTTNHKESLDEAFLRPGRLDVHAKLENASKKQFSNLTSKFFLNKNKQITELTKSYKDFKLSIAEIQEICLKYTDFEIFKKQIVNKIKSKKGN